MTKRTSIILWVLAALIVGGCGGGDDDGGGGGGSSQEPKGTEAKGSVYSVRLPEGWSDRTDDSSNEDIPIRFDRVFATKPADGFRTNVNVIRERKPERLELEEIAKVSQQQVQRAYGATDLDTPRSTTLGGEPSQTYAYSLQGQGKRLRGEQVIAVKGDRIFYVTFTSLRSAFDGHHDEFEQILSSWKWN
jgi:hypothetical protein